MPTPLHEWKLDESGSTFADTGSSASPKSATATGTTRVLGLFDYARRYDANADRILIDLLTDFTFGTAVGTFVIWFRAPTVINAQEREILAKRDSTTATFSGGIMGYGDDRLYMGFFGSPANGSVYGSKIQDGLIHCMAVTFNPSTRTYAMFVDGTRTDIITNGPSTLNNDSAQKICIGNYTASWDQSWLFSGGQEVWIDTVQLYNIILSDDEISELVYTTPSTLSLTDRDPAPSETNVLVTKSPVVAIEDSANNIVLSTVDIWVEGVLAYDGATDTWQSGFTGTRTGTPAKYTFTINPNVNFPVNDTISIRVYAENDFGNILDETYSFSTVLTTLSLTDRDPAPSETNVITNKSPIVAVQDSVYNITRTDVWVNGNLAYDGLTNLFQPNYDGPGSQRTGSSVKYTFTVDPISNFSFNSTISIRVRATNNDPNGSQVFDQTYQFTTRSARYDDKSPNAYVFHLDNKVIPLTDTGLLFIAENSASYIESLLFGGNELMLEAKLIPKFLANNGYFLNGNQLFFGYNQDRVGFFGYYKDGFTHTFVHKRLSKLNTEKTNTIALVHGWKDATSTMLVINGIKINGKWYSNMPYQSAGTGTITAFADVGGGKVRVSSTGHGMSNGTWVRIYGTVNYNDVFQISNVTADTFEIVATWAGDDAAGTWTKTNHDHELAGYPKPTFVASNYNVSLMPGDLLIQFKMSNVAKSLSDLVEFARGRM